MPVTIDVCYSVAFNDSAPWRVKSDIVKVIQGITFVKLRPYDPTLCNVVLADFLELPKRSRPSLSQTPGWKALLKCRNDAVAEQFKDEPGAEASLFGKTAKQSKKATPKLNATQLQDIRDNPAAMEFPVPGTNGRPQLLISTIRPGHPCDDLFVPMDGDSIEHIVLFMREAGIDAESILSKRHYGGMDREPGTWRNGNGSVVKKVQESSGESECEEVAASKPKRKLSRKAGKGDMPLESQLDSQSTVSSESIPITEA